MRLPYAGPAAFALVFLLGCKDQQSGTEGGQESFRGGRAAGSTMPVGNPGKIDARPDSNRTAWAVLSSDGGSITATAADGTRFVLTIPKGALLGLEEMTVTPVASLTGLPASASAIAAVQLGPDGLSLLEPATLEITPPKPLDPQTSFPIAWNRGGEDLRLYPLMPRDSGIRFEVLHFSGFAIASGSDAALSEVQQREPQRCGERYVRQLADVLKDSRRATLMGEKRAGSSEIAQMVQISKNYLAEVLQPIIGQVSKDGATLPCLRDELLSFDRTFRLMAGDSLAQVVFSKPLMAAWLAAYEASGAAFVKAADQCKRKESPLIQFYAMTSVSRYLLDRSFEDLLPVGWAASVDACGKSLEYRVGIESTIENTYRSGGRANDFSSSKTMVKATGIRVVYNPVRSASAKTPTFTTLRKVPLSVDVVAVPRKKCPDKVRVKPGSNVDVTLTPILNARVGKLICGGGKVRCDSSDVIPGVMLQLAPHVVEEVFVHTKTSAGCTPPGGWNEFMMFFQAGESTGAFEPFRVSGNQQADAVVRRGTGQRGSLSLPDIESSVATTRAVVEVAR